MSDAFKPQTIQFIDCPQHGQRRLFIGRQPRYFHDSVQGLTIVYSNHIIASRNLECFKSLSQDATDFGVSRHRSRTNRVNVELIELAKATRPRPLVPPYEADLIAAKGNREVVAVLGEDPRQRRCKIIAQSYPATIFISKCEDSACRYVAVWQVLPQRVDVFKCRCFQRSKSIALVYSAYGINHTLSRNYAPCKSVPESSGQTCNWTITHLTALLPVTYYSVLDAGLVLLTARAWILEIEHIVKTEQPLRRI